VGKGIGRLGQSPYRLDDPTAVSCYNEERM
jgi:hypothetical protein